MIDRRSSSIIMIEQEVMDPGLIAAIIGEWVTHLLLLLSAFIFRIHRLTRIPFCLGGNCKSIFACPGPDYPNSRIQRKFECILNLIGLGANISEFVHALVIIMDLIRISIVRADLDGFIILPGIVHITSLPKGLKFSGAPLFARLPERLFGQAFLP